MNQANNIYDVIIVGAGPAGATCAYILAKNNLNVLVIDKSKFPKNKLCGGLLTRKTINIIKQIFNVSLEDLKKNKLIETATDRYAIYNQHEKLNEGNLDFPFHLTARKKYDYFFLNKAKQTGVNFIFNEKIITCDVKKNEITTSSGEKFFAKFIIGADGAASKIRTSLVKQGLIKNIFIKDFATAVEAFIPRRQYLHLPNYPIIYFGYTPWGYAWSFPGPKNQVMGLGAINLHAKKVKNNFDNFLKAQGIDLKQNFKTKAWFLPYGKFLAKPGYKNFLLVGDAAGFAEPLLGEGIYYAHKSGQIAANAVLNTYKKSDLAIDYYAKKIKKPIIKEFRYAKFWRNFIFSVLKANDYKLFAFFMGLFPKKIEEVIQGKRSFKWLRPSNI